MKTPLREHFDSYVQKCYPHAPPHIQEDVLTTLYSGVFVMLRMMAAMNNCTDEEGVQLLEAIDTEVAEYMEQVLQNKAKAREGMQ